MRNNDKRIMKLCGRCEAALKSGGRLLRRVNAQHGQKVDCEICQRYTSGGYFEVGALLKKSEK